MHSMAMVLLFPFPEPSAACQPLMVVAMAIVEQLRSSALCHLRIM